MQLPIRFRVISHFFQCDISRFERNRWGTGYGDWISKSRVKWKYFEIPLPREETSLRYQYYNQFGKRTGTNGLLSYYWKTKRNKIVFQHTMPLTDFPVHRQQRKRMLFVSSFIFLLRPPAIRGRNFMDKRHGSLVTARASVHVKTG